MKNITDENILAILIDIRALIKSNLGHVEFLVIVFHNEKYSLLLNEKPPLANDDHVIVIYLKRSSINSIRSAIFQLDENFSLCLAKNDWLDQKSIDFFLLYLPICFFSLRAFELKRSITLLHFAQSLDGRIAVNNGSSKWIGNQENLVHAHRLRALFDGILIGSNTLKIDKPRLNVRLVKGPDPAKFVIGGILYEFDSLLENQGKVFFITSQKEHNHKEIETIYIPGVGNYINPTTILCELYERGIHSLFIEGGAYTASSFLSAKAIDFIQLFISPKILGSGILGFSLKEIASIDESIEFSSQIYSPMGDGVLFSGNVKY